MCRILVTLVQQAATSLRGERRGGVALILALTLVPLAMAVGLTVDYSFYVAARSQLTLAVDAAALHAVRVASQAYNSGKATTTAAIAAGDTAGAQWFAAQLGALPGASVPASNVAVNVTYNATPSTFTSNVTYNGTVSTHFGGLFGVRTWPIAGSSTAVVTNSYVEILMMLDNSPSMLIGSTLSDIVALEKATPCSTQSVNEAQDMSAYAWSYPYHNPNYGYSSGANAVPPTTVSGNCDTRYSGDSSACFYPPISLPINPTTGACTNNGGAPGVYGNHTPQAPCAFACHNSSSNNDYYGLARNIGATLRLDVVQQAAANVISTMISTEEAANQFSVGVVQFSLNANYLYPTNGAEATTDLASAQSAAANIKNNPPLTADTPDTNFGASMATLNNAVTAAGNGNSPSTPLKDLFIVTDGMNDYVDGSGNRFTGPMTTVTAEAICQPFKNKGFTVYVLYTPYLPVPNPFYLTYSRANTEPTSTAPDILALQACASSTADFYTASDPTAINAAMQSMLQAALNSAGRISH